MQSKYDECRVHSVADMFVGKWKCTILLILLFEGTKRFSELKNQIPDISKKMLTSHLRELEEEDIVKRVVHPTVPPKVEYSLSEYGETMAPLLHMMSDWGTKHNHRMREKRQSVT
ncbi:winged helix-turn-helix transcriptional regulator [Paenibacillus daejeonensis]|uniref:winged helix-turn-helix transcriptional regulator n=1 Tax=Paenibacillus daejeonensis TaxID=135193 RepID=UPI0003610A57|nr:helix-turn-helix domain-containing protein [Paenibacillus daejeonensis]